MKALHIDSSLFGDASASRHLSARIVDRLREEESGLDVTYRDLAANPPAHLTAGVFTAKADDLPGLDDVAERDARHGREMLDEFLAANIIIVGAPMYNFTIPSPLKAWLDRVMKAGVTFRYTENGPQGLVNGKRVYVASTRGGIYSQGPMAAMDHQESLLHSAFGMMGIKDVTIVRAEGIAMGSDHREQAITGAEKQIQTIDTAKKAA